MIATREAIRESLLQAAAALAPKTRLPASDWAEAHRQIAAGSSPSPGPWRNSYLPWLQPILDAFDAEPHRDGWCLMKPAQVGGTELAVTLVGYLATERPGPMLFLCTNEKQARKFSIERFGHMIKSTPVLRNIFRLGKRNGETMLLKEFAGGSLFIAGSGSPNAVVSNPMRYVFLDEEDRLQDFPGMGSARSIAEKRTSEFGTRVRTGIFSWAHPTTEDRGVAKTYLDRSDQRDWHMPCPHCDEWVVLEWSDVRIEDRDPSTARLYCPACAAEITDAQRWRATKKGEFRSTLDDPVDAARRPYIGFHLSRLFHPAVPLEDLARDYCDCKSESELQVFYNMHLGKPYTPASLVLTAEAIEAKVDPRHVDRTAPSDTAFITIGADVQKGREDVVIYCVVVAWTPNGNANVLDFVLVHGMDGLDSLIRTWSSPVGATGRELSPSVVGIDSGYHTRSVYDFCREAHGGAICIPMKHTAGVQPDNPVRKKQTKNPLMPELGFLTRFELCRNYWMDITIGRLSPLADPEVGGSVVLPAATSNDVRRQLMAARKVETIDRFGQATFHWTKEKSERDDWLQALVYAEVAKDAHLRLRGARTVKDLTEKVPRAETAERSVAEGFVTRGDRVHRSSGDRFIRGRGGGFGRSGGRYG